MIPFIIKEINSDDFIKFKNLIKTQISFADNIIINLPRNNHLLLNINIIDKMLQHNLNLNFHQDGSLTENDNKLSDDKIKIIRDYILLNLVIKEPKKEIIIII